MSAFDALLYSRAAGRCGLAPVAAWGYRRHLVDGETPRAGYQAMRKLFGCVDESLFDRLVARAASEAPLLDLAVDPEGLAAGRVEQVVATLQADGFAILDRRLDGAACGELEAAARAATCSLIGGPGHGTRARFDDAAPQAVRYDVAEEDVVAIPAAQRIIADESLLAVAQAYLGAAPVQDLVAMWWSAALGAEASDAAAQLFHFDLDRLRFLKVFVFLTDVDEATGPHAYVRGSHRRRPPALRRDGRHPDAEVEALHPGETRLVTGPRGTVFLADTIGMHKGLALERGHRLVFQTEYATSLFGAPFTRPTVADPIPELAGLAARHPRTFARFRFPGGPGPTR